MRPLSRPCPYGIGRASSYGLSGSGGVVPFSPTMLAPAGWYDMADTSTLFADTAGTVPATTTTARANDKSGNNYHATQSNVGNQPITGTRSVNGKNVLKFDGVNDMLLTPSGLWSDLGSIDYTIAAVALKDASNTGSIVSGENNGGGDVLILGWLADAMRVANNFYTVSSDISAPADALPHFAMSIRQGANVTPYYDNIVGNPAAAVNISILGLALGANGPNALNWLNGVIAEVIIVKRILTLAERANVKAYFAAKWGTVS